MAQIIGVGDSKCSPNFGYGPGCGCGRLSVAQMVSVGIMCMVQIVDVYEEDCG